MPSKGQNHIWAKKRHEGPAGPAIQWPAPWGMGSELSGPQGGPLDSPGTRAGLWWRAPL